MPKNETLTTRVTRLENALAELAEKTNILATIQRRHMDESAAREQRLDERIEKLVVAIGELISRMPPQTLR